MRKQREHDHWRQITYMCSDGDHHKCAGIFDFFGHACLCGCHK